MDCPMYEHECKYLSDLKAEVKRLKAEVRRLVKAGDALAYICEECAESESGGEREYWKEVRGK